MSSNASPPRSPLGQAVSSRAESNGQVGRPAGRLARQRRPGWIAAGVALLALAVLVNVYLFTTSGHRIAVIRVVQRVPVGQQLTRAALTTTLVALGPGVQMIPARQLSEVVGRRAAIDLLPGTLLTAAQVTTQLTPQPGQALVTVPVKPSQLPPRGLAPGSQVRIVSTAGAPGQDNTDNAGPGTRTSAKEVLATVDSVGGPDTDGTMTASLLVDDPDSSAVAQQAALGQIALVITSRQGT